MGASASQQSRAYGQALVRRHAHRTGDVAVLFPGQGTQKVGIHSIVKFEPGPTSYEFVQQCSGRGLCNGDDGLCECFTGYTSDNCDQQSALAV